MSGLSAFMAQNAIKPENEKHIISDRFRDEKGNPIPWEIKAISEDENEVLRKSCIKRTKKRGIIQNEIDQNLYLGKLVAESVVYPNLKDAELQKSYGVLGADKLAKKMLTAGEYVRLLQIVQQVNGFDVSMDELVDEAKN